MTAATAPAAASQRDRGRWRLPSSGGRAVLRSDEQRGLPEGGEHRLRAEPGEAASDQQDGEDDRRARSATSASRDEDARVQRPGGRWRGSSRHPPSFSEVDTRDAEVDPADGGAGELEAPVADGGLRRASRRSSSVPEERRSDVAERA